MKSTDPEARRVRVAGKAYQDALEERDRSIIEAFDAGATLGEISREIDMDRTSIGRLLRRYGRDTASMRWDGTKTQLPAEDLHRSS